MRPSWSMTSLPSSTWVLSPPAVKVPQKKTCFRVLADVDETAAAGQLRAELRDVDVARAVALGKAEIGLVEAAALVVVEHAGLAHDAVGVAAGAEGEPAQRRAAGDARLDGEGEVVGDALLGRDVRDELRGADAEVDHRALAQLHRGAAGDDLLVGQRQRLRPPSG